jgi:hypothetical protein
MAIFIIVLLMLLRDSDQLLNSTDNSNDIDALFNMIMNEISNIQKHEVSDNSYTRMIFILLIMLLLFSFKTKLYKMMTCFKKKPMSEDCALEKITIKELNYNVTQN